jgi:uncharacterized protein (DUF885 family)
VGKIERKMTMTEVTITTPEVTRFAKSIMNAQGPDTFREFIKQVVRSNKQEFTQPIHARIDELRGQLVKIEAEAKELFGKLCRANVVTDKDVEDAMKELSIACFMNPAAGDVTMIIRNDSK